MVHKSMTLKYDRMGLRCSYHWSMMTVNDNAIVRTSINIPISGPRIADGEKGGSTSYIDEQHGAYIGLMTATNRISAALSSRIRGSSKTRNDFARSLVKGSWGCPRFDSSTTNQSPYTAGRRIFRTRLMEE